ncbi:MAG: MarR family transcriptional regulator [Rhodobacteraceae bacterium]|nr:MarR family transcriptional regulator [Paracoccaceae bacterium]
MSDKTRKIAVLTGDLVNSTGLGPEKVERAFVALEDCAEMQAEWMGGQSLHFTRHRGDGWQVALAEPKYALRSALCFRAALRALGEEFDSYIGIAEGDVEGEVGPDLNEETNKVFSLSGNALEEIKSNKDLAYRIAYFERGAKDAASILADYISQHWSPIQAATIAPMLLPTGRPTQTEIAKVLGKTRQAVSKALGAAGTEAITISFETLEEGYQNA